MRRLAAWDVNVRSTTERSIELYERIAFFFHSVRCTDKKMLELLRHEGYVVGLRAHRRIRRGMKLYQRVESHQAEEVEKANRDALRSEFDAGNIEDFERKRLYAHMRRKYNLVGR